MTTTPPSIFFSQCVSSPSVGVELDEFNPFRAPLASAAAPLASAAAAASPAAFITAPSPGFDAAPPFDEASPLWARARFFAAAAAAAAAPPRPPPPRRGGAAACGAGSGGSGGRLRRIAAEREAAAAAAAREAAAAAARDAADAAASVRSAEEVVVPQYDAEHPLGLPCLVNVLAYVALAGFTSEAAAAAGTCKALWLRDVQLRWALVTAQHGARKMTRLHRACASGDLPRAAELLGLGASLAARDARGWTPLHFASAFGHAELVSALRARGALVDARAADGSTPLHLAGSAAERRPAPRDEPKPPLPPPPPAPSPQGPAPWTCHRDGDEVWFVSASGEVAFELPLGAHAVDAAPERRAPAAKRGGTLVNEDSGFASDAVSGAVVRALLAAPNGQQSAGIELRNDAGATPFLAAAQRGHADVLRALLKCGANANAVGGTGEAALHEAAARDGAAYTSVLSELLAHGGVAVDARTPSGRTPLMLAASHGSLEQALLLRSHGASRYARDNQNKDPWRYAYDWSLGYTGRRSLATWEKLRRVV